MISYAEVAVDSSAGLARCFTYSVPNSMLLAPGHIVEVPFNSRPVSGVVFRVSQDSTFTQAKNVSRLLSQTPLLSPIQLELAEWISFHYRASLFECAALMIPPSSQVRLICYLTVGRIDTDISLTLNQNNLISYIRNNGEIRRDNLLKTFGRQSNSALRYLLASGLVTMSWRPSDATVKPKYVDYLSVNIEKTDVKKKSESLTPKQASLLLYINCASEHISVRQAAKYSGSYAVIRSLETKGLLKRETVRVWRNPLDNKTFYPDTPPTLNDDQEYCLEQIKLAIDGTEPRVFLLHGVTGSGKTEVYLRALAHAQQKGLNGIVMVPELSLTPQTIERFSKRFPDEVAVLHSGLSRGEHFDQWWAIQRGAYGVVIGSRSAVFSPQPHLGLIIVDEEHEWTYKQQDRLPYYHSRDVAIKLSELTGSIVILGSATPDVVSQHKALSGVYTKLVLPERISNNLSDMQHPRRSMPSIQLVDLRDELKEGNKSIFSRYLTFAMQSTIRNGDQIILYLNRRGSGSSVQCRECGHVVRCVRCDSPMTYHSTLNALICHRCSHRLANPNVCPMCGRTSIRHLGVGTQKVMEELNIAFPGVRALRWDRDVASKSDAHESIMKSFAEGEAQILVGTQMIAKGHHFPNVTLVGVLCADIGLFMPDFRSGERIFQLLCQVSGRAGRGRHSGEAVIQTYSPNNYAVQAAVANDYWQFYSSEISYRQEQSLPPFSSLVNLVCIDVNEDRCVTEAMKLGDKLKNERAVWGLSNIDILGPSPAFPKKIRGRYRWHIVLRGQHPEDLLRKIHVPNGWLIDVDPMSVE